MPPTAERCPSCDHALGEDGTGRAPATPAEQAAGASAALERIHAWQTAARSAHFPLPAVPAWLEQRLLTGGGEIWPQLLDEVEERVRQRIIEEVANREKRTLARIAALADYAIDGRAERAQIEDALALGRSGEILKAIEECHQVERVVALKERHLAQARGDLDRTVAVLHDIGSLGLPMPPGAVLLAEELEGDLKAGRFAQLREKIRGLRAKLESVTRPAVPELIRRYGERVEERRGLGRPTEHEAAELARGAHALYEGRLDEALRRLARVQEQLEGAPVERARIGSAG